ncbi:N-(5'-phosphoribosyl)anthranilate isomerase [Clostridium polyendosporum]|uniref:N-(5'-phosphoribosyl)anthranilate isomerase n=1 Tax=Clostridium polyendosporum TaxID=69208 RepID=A0A919VMQ2_9CLOT|nr:phosphoribosylanthranilate isomerase [Clostridium polyendosporum]GIM29808.1 N-(5'-phosphoribosyl)anthranilate isomerase [Clostridium polyendosporum]
MTEVKICGIRRKEDIEAVNEVMPHYIGFVFAKSKRRVSIEEAENLCRDLKPGIKKVGVFVNEDYEFIKQAKEACKLDVIQLHGSENPDDYLDLGCELWKSISIKSKEDLLKESSYNNAGILLDTYSPNMAGGSGESFCWDYLKDYEFKNKWILAGGINIPNVDKALSYKPHVIDVSSGVETDGKKDRNKIIEFVRKVKGYDN